MTADRGKYEFGRHETFGLRDGWLSKGLPLVLDYSFKTDVETADGLGLGRNMVRSLGFWLDASGLAERIDGKGAGLGPTRFGDLVSDKDPHFEFAASNWFVHLHLARRPRTVWNWFFNDFRPGQFDRETCAEAFHRHVAQHASNQTTANVIGRDVACVLETYAAPPPGEAIDPEDNRISPLRALGLLLRHHETGRYEKTTPLDRVPPEAFLATVRLLCEDLETPSLPLSDLISRRNSPARLFNLDGDAIDGLARSAEAMYGSEGVELSLLGSTRTITVPESLSAIDWYAKSFERIGS